jgi:NAD(P)-dependent dehydrogenase (short-subunit alcohol dehydrogenase family)
LTSGAPASGAPSRAALVTGASRGIGRGIALALAGQGFGVVVNYVRNEAAAQDVVARIVDGGGRAVAVRADVADLAEHPRLVDCAYQVFGGLDLLVNNAGVAPRQRADLLLATPESFDHQLASNLRGPYFLTQLVARRMIDQLGAAGEGSGGRPGPKIVVVSSISAWTASTDRGDYCLAKAGLAMMVKLYAARLAAHGINVYEIRPGIIATDMTEQVREKYDRLILDQGITPIARWGTPDDVARAVIAVATDLLPFSTGQVIDVDGGFHLRTL